MPPETTEPPEVTTTTVAMTGEVPYSITETDVEVMTFGVLGLLSIIAVCLVAVVIRGG
jgi:hypothetical protein